MARPRFIEEAKLLRAAREVFVSRGAEATTREIAEAAGVSQALLFQRYGTKRHLFFAAMLPSPPDLEALIGGVPEPGAACARAYLVGLAARLLAWIDLSLPGSLRAALHPDFPDAVDDAHAPAGAVVIAGAIAERLSMLQARGDIADELAAERLAAGFIQLLHGDALASLLSDGKGDVPMRAERAVAVLWRGMAGKEAPE